VSLSGRRFAATLLALWVITFSAVGVFADAPPPSTWVALKALPHQGRTAIFSLAVDPANNQVVVAGNSTGAFLRSIDGATTWTQVHTGKATPTVIVFSPFKTGVVLAGTRGGGALLSRDGGATWSPANGLEGRVVRAFGFARTLIVAGTDKGVFISPDGSSWSQSGLAERSIDAVAVAAVNAPVRIFAGSDGPQSVGNLQLYQSIDGGATWTVLNPPISGTFVVELAASPLPPNSTTRRLIVGTNAGLFASSDNGATFVPLSGGSVLPSTDYTRVTFITDHFDRFYAASDGGGSRAGGLWRTNDAGQNFISLDPPMPSITAVAVSSDESPTLYVATFRPADHVAALWVYRDTGGTPMSPFASPSPVASGSRTSGVSSGASVFDLLKTSQAPYVAIGIAALLIVLLALVAHLRGRRH
jgi:photosystem II stability/assembly factor-like uncharacterized protein